MGGRGSSSGISGGMPSSNIASYGARAQKDSFFGEVVKTSNKYMLFDQVKDKDNAIIMTNNIKIIKGNPVMVTGKNTAIYLRDNQFKLMKQRDGIEAFAVKISRERFKEYTFKSGFDEFSFSKKDTFDSLWKTAAKQQRKKQTWRSGKAVIISTNAWREYK